MKIPHLVTSLHAKIKQNFPKASVEIDVPEKENGHWYIDVILQNQKFAILHVPNREIQFGISKTTIDNSYTHKLEKLCKLDDEVIDFINSECKNFTMNCRYCNPYQGGCKKSANESGFCDEHNLLCVVCKKQATHGCDSAGSLVCGSPLCDECTHSVSFIGYSLPSHLTKEQNKKIIDIWFQCSDLHPNIESEIHNTLVEICLKLQKAYDKACLNADLYVIFKLDSIKDCLDAIKYYRNNLIEYMNNVVKENNA